MQNTEEEWSNTKNIGRGRVIVCLIYFEKIALKHLFSSSPLSSSFLVIQNLMGAPNKVLQIFIVFQKQKCNNQRFYVRNPNLF
jgi:hypothetical protein